MATLGVSTIGEIDGDAVVGELIGTVVGALVGFVEGELVLGACDVGEAVSKNDGVRLVGDAVLDCGDGTNDGGGLFVSLFSSEPSGIPLPPLVVGDAVGCLSVFKSSNI